MHSGAACSNHRLSIRRKIPVSLLFAATCAIATAPAAHAQEAAPGKEFRAFRITGEAPRLDGVIDDEAWLAAESIDDFMQQEPDNMAAPRERTVIQVAYDDRFLYIAARCYARDPSTSAPGSDAAAPSRTATRSASRSIRGTTT